MCCALPVLRGQGTPPAALLNWDAGDGKCVAELTAGGERRDGKLVILFTPKGAVDDQEETALIERLDRGPVVGKIGLAETIQLMPLILTDGVLPRIEKLAGAPMTTLRAEWRAAIGAP